MIDKGISPPPDAQPQRAYDGQGDVGEGMPVPDKSDVERSSSSGLSNSCQESGSPMSMSGSKSSSSDKKWSLKSGSPMSTNDSDQVDSCERESPQKNSASSARQLDAPESNQPNQETTKSVVTSSSSSSLSSTGSMNRHKGETGSFDKTIMSQSTQKDHLLKHTSSQSRMSPSKEDSGVSDVAVKLLTQGLPKESLYQDQNPISDLTTQSKASNEALKVDVMPSSQTSVILPHEQSFNKNSTSHVPASSPPLVKSSQPGFRKSQQVVHSPGTINHISNSAGGGAVVSVLHSNPVVPTSTTTTTQPKSPGNLRRGKWTAEEEAYVARVIQDFNSGFLNAPAGTTLRTYLSEKLHCDPMRITKKFTGDSCIGKRVFHPAVRCANNSSAIDKAHSELDALERRWRRRLEMQQRESAKKAAASAAAAAAAGRSHLHPQVAQLSQTGGAQQTPITGSQQIARTATWLERANLILSSKLDGSENSSPNSNESSHNSYKDRRTEDQIKEVERLIHEGPIIQQTSVGLPLLLEKSSSTPGVSGQDVNSGTKRKVSDDDRGRTLSQSATAALPSVAITSSPHGFTLPEEDTVTRARSGSLNVLFKGPNYRPKSPSQPPQDKLPRRSKSSTHLSAYSRSTTGDEDDAQALVGFLNSVRASAAASAARPFPD